MTTRDAVTKRRSRPRSRAARASGPHMTTGESRPSDTVNISRSTVHASGASCVRGGDQANTQRATRRRRTATMPTGAIPNLVQGLTMVRPHHVWVGDLTSVRLREEFVSLAVLMDVYTRGIRSWHLSRHLDQALT
jgi:putative transposase